MQKINVIFLSALFLSSYVSGTNTPYVELGEAQDKQDVKGFVEAKKDAKTDKERHDRDEAFQQAYKKEFARIWRNRKKYYAAHKKNHEHEKISQEECLISEMKQAYIKKLKEFYPNSKWFSPQYMPDHERRAEDHARSYIENDTFTGCCF